MKNKIITLVCFFLLFCSGAYGTEYDVYVSDDAGGNLAAGSGTGVGTTGDPFKNFTEVNTYIDGKSSGDVVNIWCDSDDTWTYDTDADVVTTTFVLTVTSSNPVVHIGKYGAGNKPCFEGTVTDFSVAPAHDWSGDPNPDGDGPLFWSKLFQFEKAGCSMTDIEIKEVYGFGVNVDVPGDDYFTMTGCNIHHVGCAGITVPLSSDPEYITVEYTTVHTGQQLWRYSFRNGWGAAISLITNNGQEDNNIVRNCLVYDIYGEGINIPNSLAEYNVVGDTSSIGINSSPHQGAALTTVIRFNIVTHSDWDTSVYDGMHGGGSSPTGIRAFDEEVGGDNSAGDISIYGNIVINRQVGIWFFNSKAPGNPFGKVRIYNNTLIDNRYNIVINNPEECNDGYIYNNLSVLYDGTSYDHDGWSTTSTHPNWTVSNNHFWTTGGAYTSTTQFFSPNAIFTDPQLAGEPSITWGEQDGATYFKDITVVHVTPSQASDCVDGGDDGTGASAGFDATSWRVGADFTPIPELITIVLGEQGDYGIDWDTGAIISSIVESGGTVFTQPSGNITEAGVRYGGSTIILTASGTEWVSDLGDDNSDTDALIAGLACAAPVQTAGFAAQFESLMAHGQFTRNSATEMQFDMPVAASYALTQNEVWTWTIPATALVSDEETVASPNITISNESEGAASSSIGIEVFYVP